jgi:hypothetical protein
VEKPEGKRPLEISRRRFESGIKMDLNEIIQDVVGCIAMFRDKDKLQNLVNTIMDLRVF